MGEMHTKSGLWDSVYAKISKKVTKEKKHSLEFIDKWFKMV